MTRNIQATDAQGNKVSEPVQINGVDPTSSGGGGAFEDGDGDGIYTLPNAGDGIDVGPVDADKASITNETLVNAYLSANQSVSATTWVTCQLDAENKDERSEFDTTAYQFVPDETGFYYLDAMATFGVGADGDRFLLRVRNVTDGVNIIMGRNTAGSAQLTNVGASGTKKLLAGKNHELQVQNNDSSDTVYSGKANTYLTVRRAMR